jgi:hypothetical protein
MHRDDVQHFDATWCGKIRLSPDSTPKDAYMVQNSKYMYILKPDRRSGCPSLGISSLKEGLKEVHVLMKSPLTPTNSMFWLNVLLRISSQSAQNRTGLTTRSTVFTHPSFSGLLVTWAYLLHTTLPDVVTKPSSETLTSRIVPLVKTPALSVTRPSLEF